MFHRFAAWMWSKLAQWAAKTKEREQLVGVAGMRDVDVELRSIEMTTGSRAAR